MPLEVERLGCVAYAQALGLQLAAVDACRERGAANRLLLLEHPPVVTLGRGADQANLRLTRQELAARGIEVHDVARGGDITYHAPGQLVGYLIVDLEPRGRDVLAHLRGIEAALCAALAGLGVSASTRPGMTGVFAADAAAARPRKLASIGVGVRRWVSHHGFALNVDLDLAGFAAIVPCGLRDVEMTSLARELGAAAPRDLGRRAADAVAEAFLSAPW